jgi:hypothetical protein
MAKKRAANLLPKLTETEQDLLSHIQDGYRLGAGLERSPLRQKATRKLQESYKKATDRRIFIPPSTMAKSLGALGKSFEVSDK